jgi:Family of unknown function (DUF5994)
MTADTVVRPDPAADPAAATATRPDATVTPLVRVSLKPPGEYRGMVEGAWWPRSRDLAREFALLVAFLEKKQKWPQILRATVNVRMWPQFPKAFRIDDHNVHLGWFDAEQDPHTICLVSRTAQRWDLAVVPPECSADRAADIMAAAADIHNKQTASALVASDVSEAPAALEAA